MEKSRTILYGILALVIIAFSLAMLNSRNDEISRLKSNIRVWQDSVDSYRIRDSLSAMQVEALRLKSSEFEQMYAAEHSLVTDLRADRVGLVATIALQQKTINRLQASFTTVYVHDTVLKEVDSLKCFGYKDTWIDLWGCIKDSVVDVDLCSYDSLFVAESVQRKRFLGIPLPIRWFGYRSKTVDVVSLNPHTEVTGVVYKTIEQ